MKKVVGFLALFVLILQSCGTRNIYFNVPVPPIKAVHPDIKRVVLVDRTAPENKEGDIVEGILTGEGFDQDQKNKQRALLGAEEQLRNSGRFTVIRASEVLKGSKNGEVMSPALKFEKIQELCDEYNVDAVVAMELYDSDFVITHGMKPSEGFSFYAEGVAKIDIGFRMYDGFEKNLIDEHSFTHDMRWNTGGSSIQDALSSLLKKNEAIRRISYDAGIIYAKRLTPSSIRVRREYYNKGSDQLEYGARMMEVNDWEEAKKALKEVINNSNSRRKHKGRAAHNLAIVYEILGDLEEAKKWAADAWGKYENKDSRDYVYILNRRMN